MYIPLCMRSMVTSQQVMELVAINIKAFLHTPLHDSNTLHMQLVDMCLWKQSMEGLYKNERGTEQHLPKTDDWRRRIRR